MMNDPPEDHDLKLQRVSADLIAEFEISLPRFLWRAIVKDHDTSTQRSRGVRRLVREAKTDQLIKLLEPFQEWPQLLDRHLNNFVQSLVDAFLAYLTAHAGDYYRAPQQQPSANVIPLPRAICKILYTLCKVRGQKIIAQLLNNEAKYLEPVLDAFQAWNKSQSSPGEDSGPPHGWMVWEERYAMLLWLSHLMLAPFDLISISSDGDGGEVDVEYTDVALPVGTPTLARRLIYTSLRYLGSASKERDAAKILLVRLALRTDMRELGLPQILIDWAISILHLEGHQKSAFGGVYNSIGILSFLAGFVTSAESVVKEPLLLPIFDFIQEFGRDQNPSDHQTMNSAVAHKLMVKIYRALAAHRANVPRDDEIMDTAVSYLLAALDHRDTSVRLAASKALSVIAVQVGPDMASQIVENILQTLEGDFSWQAMDTGRKVGCSQWSLERSNPQLKFTESFEPNFSAVNALRWHGLILALSHLTFRHSIPLPLLPSSMTFLVLALDFEQRSSLGTSVGTNVRDAACFGLWALARKYPTSEVCTISSYSVDAVYSRYIQTSALQLLANELVVAASLDPAGNVRRGASAALQELVGRHPDTIICGEELKLVQTVDYHAVASASKALFEVGVVASTIDDGYWRSLFGGLSGWRGVKSPDVNLRRRAGSAMGLLALQDPPVIVSTAAGSREGTGPSPSINAQLAIKCVRDQLRRSSFSQVHERHGLLCALAEIVIHLHKAKHGQLVNPGHEPRVDESELAELWQAFYIDHRASASREEDLRSSLRSEYTLEAQTKLILALAESCSCHEEHEYSRVPFPTHEVLEICFDGLTIPLVRPEEWVYLSAAMAAERLLQIACHEVRNVRLAQWTHALNGYNPGLLGRQRMGLITTLASVVKHVDPKDSGFLPERQLAIVDLLAEEIDEAHSIEVRSHCLRWLTSNVLSFDVCTASVLEGIQLGLNDYTLDERGDIGSLVRVEAIDAASMALQRNLVESVKSRQVMIARICGLAVEKLDRVRYRAARCLQSIWGTFDQRIERINVSETSQISNSTYFLQVLALCSEGWTRMALLEGFVTSAGNCSELLLQVSRAALVEYTGQLTQEDLGVFCTYLVDVVRTHLTNDRLLLPALEVLGFLFDSGITLRLERGLFAWRKLFDLTHKAHFQSTNVRKLHAAVRIYSGLAGVQKIRPDVLKRLCNMLKHRYPNVRNAVADALFLAVGGDDLMRVNWSKPTKELSEDIEIVRTRLGIVTI